LADTGTKTQKPSDRKANTNYVRYVRKYCKQKKERKRIDEEIVVRNGK
jgi:hypothetical protein